MGSCSVDSLLPQMYLLLYKLLETKYSISIPVKRLLTCTLVQVPKVRYDTDVAAHGCIHLGRSAHYRPCHWIPDNGRLDSTYPEIHNYYCCNRRCLPCCSNNNTLYHKWRPFFHVWNVVSLRCHKQSDLRADQHNTGKDVCFQVGLQLYASYYVTAMQGQHSEYRDICTAEFMSLTLNGSFFVMRTPFDVGMFM